MNVCHSASACEVALSCWTSSRPALTSSISWLILVASAEPSSVPRPFDSATAPTRMSATDLRSPVCAMMLALIHGRRPRRITQRRISSGKLSGTVLVDGWKCCEEADSHGLSDDDICLRSSVVFRSSIHLLTVAVLSPSSAVLLAILSIAVVFVAVYSLSVSSTEMSICGARLL